MTREEHLNWCKQQAIEYIDAGDSTNAWASMVEDLIKHDELKDHLGIWRMIMADISTDTPFSVKLKFRYVLLLVAASPVLGLLVLQLIGFVR